MSSITYYISHAEVPFFRNGRKLFVENTLITAIYSFIQIEKKAFRKNFDYCA